MPLRYEMRRAEVLKIACLCVLVALMSLRCAAQATSAEISGSITDPSGAVVPGSTVTAANIETGTTQSTKSEDNGDYVLTNLRPGTYTLTAEASGFSKLVQAGLNLQVNQQVRLN